MAFVTLKGCVEDISLVSRSLKCNIYFFNIYYILHIIYFKCQKYICIFKCLKHSPWEHTHGDFFEVFEVLDRVKCKPIE